MSRLQGRPTQHNGDHATPAKHVAVSPVERGGRRAIVSHRHLRYLEARTVDVICPREIHLAHPALGIDPAGQPVVGAADQRQPVLDRAEHGAGRLLPLRRAFAEPTVVGEVDEKVEMALRVLSESAPDIIVLDLQMADMDGLKVLAFTRGDDRVKSMPALVLSARGTASDIERAKSAGADAFLVKMMTSPVKLSEQVKKLLGK